MYELFTVHIWFAIVGGAIGGISAFYSKDNGKIKIGEVFIDFLISIITGVSVTTWWFNKPEGVSPFVFLGVSVFFGGSSRMLISVSRGALLEFIKAKSGDAMSVLLDAAAKRIANAQVKIEREKEENQ